MSEYGDETRGYPGRRPDQGQDGQPRDDDYDLARESSAFPADLAAVQADDALLDALGGSHSTISPSDEPLANVLLQWRREVDAEPIGELIDTDTAMALVARARRPAPRRKPVLLPFAAAAAMLVIAFSGIGLAAKSAVPGDRLWSVTQVLYSEHARSVEAANTIRRDLQEADAALDQGRTAVAERALARAERDLGVVAADDGRSQLADRHEELLNELAGQPGDQDEQSGPTAGDSSSESPSDQQPPVEQSGPVEQSTSPSDDATSTSEPEPSTATSTPMAETPDDGARTNSAPNDSGGESVREPQSGATLGTGGEQPPMPAPAT